MSDDGKVKKILANEKSIKDLIKTTERLSHKINKMTSIQNMLMTENRNLKQEIAFLKNRYLE